MLAVHNNNVINVFEPNLMKLPLKTSDFAVGSAGLVRRNWPVN